VTLYITPVYYVYLDKLQRKFSRRKRKPETVSQEELNIELVGQHD
jgi:hypothetical protein